jgi:hypothetical protein
MTDINDEEYEFITTLMDLNEEMRVILVGDDDQNMDFGSRFKIYAAVNNSEKCCYV